MQPFAKEEQIDLGLCQYIVAAIAFAKFATN